MLEPAHLPSPAARRTFPVASRGTILVFAGLALLILFGYQALIGLDLIRGSGFHSVRSTGVLAAYAVAIAVLTVIYLTVAPAAVRPVTYTVLGLSAAFLVITLLWSGQILDFVAAALTLGAAWYVGDLALRRFAPSCNLRSAPGVSFALGYTLLANLVLVVGLAGLLRTWTLGPPILVLGVLGARVGIRHARQDIGTTEHAALPGSTLFAAWTDRFVGFTVASIALLFAIAAVWTGAPEIQFDAVHYKEWLPSIWADEGRIWFPIVHPAGVMFGSTFVLPVFGHLFGAQAVGAWTQYLVGFVAVSTLWRLCVQYVNVRLAAFAAMLFASTPHVIWQMSTAYDDLILTSLTVGLTSALLALSPCAHQIFAPVSHRSAFIVGILAGGLIAGKLHLTAFATAAALGWAVYKAAGKRLRRIALIGLGATAALAPLVLSRWIATGNPVFPQLNNIFKSRYFPPVNATFNLPFGSGTVFDLLKWPVRAIARPSPSLVEAAPPGAFGALIVSMVLAPIAAFFGGRRTRVLGIALVTAYVVWWVQFRYLRYMLPYGAVGIAVIAASLRSASAPAWRRGSIAISIAACSAAMILVFPSTMASFWNIPERFPARVVFGRESEEDYLSRTLGGSIEVARAIAEYALPGDHVIGSSAYVRTHVPNDVETSAEWEFALRRSISWPEVSHDPSEVFDRWQAYGATMIATDTQWRISGYDVEEELLLDNFAQLVWAGNYQELYRLTRSPESPIDVSICDAEFSGDGACWSMAADEVPGLSADEAPHGAVQTVPVCPGALYLVTFDVADGLDSTLATVATTDPDGRLVSWQQIRIPGGRSEYLAQTVPDDAKLLTIHVEPQGTAVVTRAEVGGYPTPDCPLAIP